MQQLRETNHALGDRIALLKIMEEQGYWFFRDVLDRDALARVYDLFMAELRDMNLVDAGVTEPVWNGRTPLALDDGVTSSRYPRLREGRVWENFVKEPAIVSFFAALAGEEPEWLTASDYYRIVPPGQDRGEHWFDLRHQDGQGLPGLDFVTCWIPLADADSEVGGLAIVPGSNRHGVVGAANWSTQDLDEWFNRDLASQENWARADYRLGDVLIFTGAMLHSGLRNQSGDRFRFSLDIRMYMHGSPRPITGPLESITPDEIVIRNGGTERAALKITNETNILVTDGDNDIPRPFTRAEAPSALLPGRQVMAVGQDGSALIIRPANSGGY